ncbi:hypothetical protein BH11PLA2_BH11PLA2_24520 [soil metagenome]
MIQLSKDILKYESLAPMPIAFGSQYRAAQEGVSIIKRAEARLRDLAMTDPLTGLMNRAGLNDKLATLLIGKPVALHFINLDQFKRVNDALGYHAGDELLKQVANRFRRRVCATDIICRLGGDEFAIIQTGVHTPDDAANLARSLIESLDPPFVIGKQELTVRASIGITLFPHDGDDPGMVLKNADLAMFLAKQEGGATFRFFAPGMEIIAQSRLSLEGEIRLGIALGEFELYFQPQVVVSDGSVIGAEALLRWKHPTRGILTPGVFLPVAEDSGLILPLSEWTLQTACEEARGWLTAGRPLRVAVNVSVTQVQRGDLVETVRNILQSSRLPTELLELEITEGLLLPDVPLSSDVLRNLHDLGVTMAIDDFGTGYSSLSYLHRLPVDRLKIDRSFVMRLPGGTKDAALVRAMIGLGHDFGLKVIAEGVETAEQLAFLQAEECDEAQGFFFSPPVPVAEFTMYLATHSDVC